MASEFVAKHKWKLFLSGLTVTGAATAVVAMFWRNWQGGSAYTRIRA
jgi:hypothetical protein